MDSRKRGHVIGRLLDALLKARKLSGKEFPHLARGPPEAVELVRITEDDLGDGGTLIAFGWRDRKHAPGVIVVPGRVARIVEQLIAADPEFADWWARLLRHELDFHIDGDEHTGHRHDTHAADLAREYDAQWHSRRVRDDVALRRTRVGEWDPAFLRELAAGSSEEALLSVLDAQGMNGTPTLVSATDWRELLAADHQPMYRGIYGEQAEEQAERFRTGERPFVGWGAQMGGSGSNFDTDPAIAGKRALMGGVFPNPFRPLRRPNGAEVVLVGYLHRDGRVLDAEQASTRRDADVAAARQRGDEELAKRLADLGVWAALSGIDAVFVKSGTVDRHYLVLNRGALFVETAEPRVSDLWAGEREVNCNCGERHLGTYGAAGLLVVYRAADRTVWLLMHRRSDASQHGRTWGLPGGVRGLRETAERAAMRETWEEVGLDPSTYTVRGAYVDDHGNWSYTTVLAETRSLVTARVASVETAEVTWVRLGDLATLPLHPDFAASWPDVSAALLGDAHTPRSAPASSGLEEPQQPGVDDVPTSGADTGRIGTSGAVRGGANALLRHVINRHGPPPGDAVGEPNKEKEQAEPGHRAAHRPLAERLTDAAGWLLATRARQVAVLVVLGAVVAALVWLAVVWLGHQGWSVPGLTGVSASMAFALPKGRRTPGGGIVSRELAVIGEASQPVVQEPGAQDRGILLAGGGLGLVAAVAAAAVAVTVAWWGG